MILIKLLIITGNQSYSIILDIIKSIPNHYISVEKAPVSVSAFITKQMTKSILEKMNESKYDLVILPGFVQWDTKKLEEELEIPIRKGPEFASDLPIILKSLDGLSLSNKIPANKLLKSSGENAFFQYVEENYNHAKANLGSHTFYLNKNKSDLMIGRNLPPLIIAEIVNCTEKEDEEILKKVQHYLESGADIIDIGCVANKPNPHRISQIIQLIRQEHSTLISVDSMDSSEISSAIENKIDLILSLDFGNYKQLLGIDKQIPIVILPTNINEGYFPRDPETRVNNLIKLTKIMQEFGFRKLIADPLLETPIAPSITNSLEAYFLYKKEVSKPENKDLELPMFFGVSNVVELMDIDSVGINGLLASIAVELDMGVLFTVEHSAKMMNGVSELKECTKLNYLAKQKKTPPINQGIQVFRSKGKINDPLPKIKSDKIIQVVDFDPTYQADDKGYFKIYIDHYSKMILLLFYSLQNKLIYSIKGNNAEALSKKIISLDITKNLEHLMYLGRELKKAELYLNTGKPYFQDE